ncbi:MAG TPA: DUF2520 domain-containing protein [Xanthomonadales bacterium]|nr:DUF2520 domain-containing protein [Xanthomonadales bacterium]
MLVLNIIGCGRAGGSVASALARTGLVTIGQVLNRSPSSTHRAVARLGAGDAVETIGAFSRPDVWLIATPDDSIGLMAQELAARRPGLSGQAVFHLSGRYGPGVLATAGDRGAETAAVHPVRSMPVHSTDVDQFRDTICIAEGSDAALRALRSPFEASGACWKEVKDLNRGLYHAALAIVSNVTKGVVWKAQKWLEQAGLEPEVAAQASHSLLSITAADLNREGARQSITGPVVRGDTSTVEAHLGALQSLGAHDTDVYRILALTVLDLANERGNLDDQTLRRFDELLGGGKS